LDVHRAARTCSAGWGGQILLSQTTCDLLGQDLPGGAELGDLGEHRLKDLLRPEHLFQVRHPDLPADFPPLRSLSPLLTNLPIQLTSFVGREREMAEVKRLLATSRLLTLTGAGGSGKTRLALQAAAEVLDDYAHGVWVVELAALSNPALVPQAVASPFGVREQPGRPLAATLADYLQPRTVLLVLDNCEHVVAACAQLAEALLRSCANLRILATSREALNIPGESAWRVPSLSLPEPGRLPPVESLVQYEAVRLFVERTLAALPGFTVTDRNAPAVVQVCHQLDGIPLAIELAAGQAKVLSVEQIATRLDDRFRLLVRGSRTALPRHQTLRAAMDWSYDLLSEREQALLRRLSVFAGGFTLEAAEVICADDSFEQADVLDLLANLVDKSLVLMEEYGDGIRYRLLETVRQYTRDKLQESGEAPGVRARHRDWYLGLVERAERQLLGPDQGKWLKQLETEHDNLRAAQAWSMEHSPEAAMRLAMALGHFWEVRGYLSEGRERLAAALSRAEAGRTLMRAKALNAAGRLALHQGDYAAAGLLNEESLAIFRELGEKPGIATVLNNLGLVAFRQGNYASAHSRYEESLAMNRELLDDRGVAIALNNLGNLAHAQGDWGAARACYEEGLAIRRELGDRRGIANSLNSLGIAALSQGDYAAARAFWDESLVIFRELGDRRGTAIAQHNLGALAHREGDYPTARTLFEESLTIYRELGDKTHIAESFEGLAGVACAQGQQERAARLFGAVEVLREALHAPLPPAARPDYEGQVAAVRAALGESAFAAARAKGRAMPLEQAISEAFDAPAQA
jgi:predicted ATPase